MTTKRDRASLIAYYKKSYRKKLEDLQFIIKGELEGIDDEGFTSTTAIQTGAINAIVAGERLNALTEISE